jgi:ribosomal protein S18 acetylase RimI-like enzyme
MLLQIFTLGMALIGLVWLVGAIPAVFKSWNSAPRYYSTARLLLPLIVVGVFLPRLFISSFPADQPLLFVLLIIVLFYVSGAVLFYLYTQPGEYTPRSVTDETGQTRLQLPDGRMLPLIDHRRDDSVIVRPARPEDLPGAGEIFAEVFGHTFDLSFGPDRQRNSRILADLLGIKLNELLVAVEGEEVAGALWLDLAGPSTPKANFKTVYPVMRKYMSRWYALYFAYLGVPGMMAVRGSKEQGYVQWLGVLPQWQGHHVARKLMNKAEELSTQAAKKTIGLHTERANKPARQLYRHLGFTERGFLRITPRVYYVKDLEK